MAQILRSKNLATKFQILLEIAAKQPNIQQKDIAAKLNITSQAVSAYARELIKDGWLSSQGRSRYKVTREGIDWILRMARQLQNYSYFVNKVVADISLSAAIADTDLSADQPVSLYMKDGLLFASGSMTGKGARGIAASGAKKGKDVGVSSVEGVIKLKPGKITIGKVPNVQRGGSENTNLARLKEQVSKGTLIGAIGVEALVALKRIVVKPDYRYGVKEAATEAAYSGLPFLIICAEAEVLTLAQRLEEEDLDYEIVALDKIKPLPTH